MEAAIERFFKVGERGSSLGTEVMAGLTTFLTMAYIVAVNPAMMEAAGIPFNAALTATCFGAAVMTAAMGLIANRPIALASGMGINAIVAFTLCGSMGLDWRIAMGVVPAWQATPVTSPLKRALPLMPVTMPSGRSRALSTGPCSMCTST